MENLDVLTEVFKMKYDRFMISCKMQERLDIWNAEEYGEIDVFFQNHLLVFILRIIVADEKIEEDEVRYVNSAFGFQYTKYDLAASYAECRDVLGAEYDKQFREDLAMLKELDEDLFQQYVELLNSVCDIIIGSDGIVDDAEIREAQKIKELFLGI